MITSQTMFPSFINCKWNMHKKIRLLHTEVEISLSHDIKWFASIKENIIHFQLFNVWEVNRPECFPRGAWNSSMLSIALGQRLRAIECIELFPAPRGKYSGSLNKYPKQKNTLSKSNIKATERLNNSVIYTYVFDHI